MYFYKYVLFLRKISLVVSLRWVLAYLVGRSIPPRTSQVLTFSDAICISKIKMIFQSFLEVLLNKEFYNFIDQIEHSVQIKIKNHEILIMKYLKKCQLFINIFYFRSSRPYMFCKKGVLESFAKFYGKHLCQSLFFNKAAGLRPAAFLKKRHWDRCFPVNFTKFLRSPFFTEQLRWLLLLLQYFLTFAVSSTPKIKMICNFQRRIQNSVKHLRRTFL